MLATNLDSYRRTTVMPETNTKILVCNAGSSSFKFSLFDGYIGKRGRMIGMKTFGASAPLKELQRKFGFTPASIVTAAKVQIAQGR